MANRIKVYNRRIGRSGKGVGPWVFVRDYSSHQAAKSALSAARSQPEFHEYEWALKSGSPSDTWLGGRNPRSTKGSGGLPVIYRKWNKTHGGDLIALFPTEPADAVGYSMMSYETIGQHGAANYAVVYMNTVKPTDAEVAKFKKELEEQGYDNLVRYRREQPWFLTVRQQEARGRNPTNKNPKRKKSADLSVPEKHMIAVARKTLNTPDAIANYLAASSNAPTKEEAREILRKYGHYPERYETNPRGANVRFFNGKPYTSSHKYLTRSEAKSVARSIRSRGYNARAVNTEPTGWSVYVLDPADLQDTTYVWNPLRKNTIWVGQHTATRKWYAIYGNWEQWGQTKRGAIANLRKFASKTMNEPIPTDTPVRRIEVSLQGAR